MGFCCSLWTADGLASVLLSSSSSRPFLLHLQRFEPFLFLCCCIRCSHATTEDSVLCTFRFRILSIYLCSRCFAHRIADGLSSVLLFSSTCRPFLLLLCLCAWYVAAFPPHSSITTSSSRKSTAYDCFFTPASLFSLLFPQPNCRRHNCICLSTNSCSESCMGRSRSASGITQQVLDSGSENSIASSLVHVQQLFSSGFPFSPPTFHIRFFHVWHVFCTRSRFFILQSLLAAFSHYRRFSHSSLNAFPTGFLYFSHFAHLFLTHLTSTAIYAYAYLPWHFPSQRPYLTNLIFQPSAMPYASSLLPCSLSH